MLPVIVDGGKSSERSLRFVRSHDGRPTLFLELPCVWWLHTLFPFMRDANKKIYIILYAQIIIIYLLISFYRPALSGSRQSRSGIPSLPLLTPYAKANVRNTSGRHPLYFVAPPPGSPPHGHLGGDDTTATGYRSGLVGGGDGSYAPSRGGAG